MTMDRAYIEPLYLLVSFLKFYVLNVVSSLFDWIPNGEFFGIDKSSVNLKDPPIISQPKNAHEPLFAHGFYSGFYGI